MNPLIIDIIVTLHIIFKDSEAIDLWLKESNKVFNSEPPWHLIQTGRANLVSAFIEAFVDSEDGYSSERLLKLSRG